MPHPSLEGFTSEQVEASAALYQQLLGNPQTREIALRATKVVSPKLSIPEIDVKDQIAANNKAWEERVAKMEEERIKEAADNRIRAQRAALKDQGFSQADIDAIEKKMVDEGIVSHESAAKYFRQERQLAEPTPSTGNAPGLTFSLPEDPMKAMAGGKNGAKQWARDQAAAAIADIQAGRVRLPA